MSNVTVAVLVPCHNEAQTIARVLKDFRWHIPSATIYVYDNNSTDNTAEIALANGAIVCQEKLQGKGNVVRRMFADIEADIYVLVDGDATYDPSAAPTMIRMLCETGLEMVTAKREAVSQTAYRPGHRLGNRLLSTAISVLFGNGISDMLSGYRVFSRRFVKSFPALSSGFEIETELSVHALEMRMAMEELTTPYTARPVGSDSKLSTYRDGLRIIRTIANLVRDERPLAFFSIIAFCCFLVSVVLSIPIFIEFAATGLVPRLPTAVLCTGLALLSVILFSCGLVLDTVSRGRREMKRLHFLGIPTPLTVPKVTQIGTALDASQGEGRRDPVG